jgi:hypothetical protein
MSRDPRMRKDSTAHPSSVFQKHETATAGSDSQEAVKAQSRSDACRRHSDTGMASSTQHTKPFAAFQVQSREILGTEERSR